MSTLSTPNNPFNPGSGVPPPYLAGREKHLEKFAQMLNRIKEGQIENLIVYGLRGTGKTVLMDEFSKSCISHGFLPVKRSQFSKKYCDPDEFTKALKYDIKTAIRTFSRVKRMKDKFTSVLSYIRPKEVGIPDVFYYEPSYNTTSGIPFEDHLKEYLLANWKVFENGNYKGVIFLFDEFHSVYDIEYKKWFVLSDFIGVLNEVQKKHCKYFAVFCGLPNLHLNVKEARSYSERMYKSMEVGNLNREEATSAIVTPLDRSEFQFEKPLIERIVVETGQYPYFIQFYCKELINMSGKKKILLNDYERFSPSITKQLDDDFFDPRMDALSDEEQKVIIAMAHAKDMDIPFDFIKKKARIERTTLSKYMKRLEDKGLIYNYKRGVYRFSVPLLKKYILRKFT
ncbi:MAG: AAA family ATPase [Nitrosotalea sp.]